MTKLLNDQGMNYSLVTGANGFVGRAHSPK